MRKRVPPLSSILAACAFILCAACTQRTRVLVNGEAETKVQPDTAVVVSVEAQRENARKTNAVIEAVLSSRREASSIAAPSASRASAAPLPPTRTWQTRGREMSPRTPVEAGSLNVRSQVQLLVEVTTPSKAWAR